MLIENPIPPKFDLHNDDINSLPNTISLLDHLGGFDSTLKSFELTQLSTMSAYRNITVDVEYIVDQQIRNIIPI